MTDLYRDSRLDPDLELKIRDLVLNGKVANARQLHAVLGGKGKAPDIRVLRQRFAHYTPRNDSGDWSMKDADRDDAALVLDTLAAVHASSADPDDPTAQVRRFSQAEGDWIVRVRRARPDLVPDVAADPNGWRVGAVQAYQFARRYLWHDEHGVPTTALDLDLAMVGKVGRVSVLPAAAPPGSKVVGRRRRRRDLEQRLAADMKPREQRTTKEGGRDGTAR